MKKLVLGCLTIVLLSSACKTASPVVNTVATTAIDCAKPAISKVALDTLTDGELSLVRDDWKNSLSSLVAKYGIEVVACVVGHVFNQSSQDLRASSDPNATTKSSRAKIWLEENKIVFTSAVPTN